MSPINTAEILITALTLVCLATVIMGLKKALRLSTIPISRHNRIIGVTAFIMTLWLVIIGLLSYEQLFAAPGLPPRPMFTVLGGLIVIIILSFTTTGKQLLKAVPLHWLVFFQVFRIGVELWFWYAYKINVLPQIMTFEGANLDIVAGFLALVAGFFILRSPKYAKITALVFNITGLLLLLNTLRAAALSMPSAIQQYPFDERLLLLGQPYFIYLPSVLVVLALGLHILSLRQLAIQRDTKQFKAAVLA